MVIVCSKFDRNRTTPAELFAIWLILAPITSQVVTLTFDRLTLNMCGRSCIMRSTSVPNLSEIDQSAAELLMINDGFFVRF